MAFRTYKEVNYFTFKEFDYYTFKEVSCYTFEEVNCYKFKVGSIGLKPSKANLSKDLPHKLALHINTNCYFTLYFFKEFNFNWQNNFIKDFFKLINSSK